MRRDGTSERACHNLRKTESRQSSRRASVTTERRVGDDTQHVRPVNPRGRDGCVPLRRGLRRTAVHAEGVAIHGYGERTGAPACTSR